MIINFLNNQRLMKQIVMTMMLCLAALTATGQTPNEGDVREKMFEAKVRELVYRLHISDEQKPKFVPIYRRYCDEMAATWGNDHPRGPKRMKEGKEGKANNDVKQQPKPQKPTTGKEAAELQKRKMERQQKAQAVRIKYIDELATVLDAEQVSRFFEVEGKIQKKLMDRKKHPKGMKRKDGKKGKNGKKRQERKD